MASADGERFSLSDGEKRRPALSPMESSLSIGEKASCLFSGYPAVAARSHTGAAAQRRARARCVQGTMRPTRGKPQGFSRRAIQPIHLEGSRVDPARGAAQPAPPLGRVGKLAIAQLRALRPPAGRAALTGDAVRQSALETPATGPPLGRQYGLDGARRMNSNGQEIWRHIIVTWAQRGWPVYPLDTASHLSTAPPHRTTPTGS
jgi:hypothetical protein